MTLVETFRAEVEAFMANTDMTATAFGKAAVGDPNFVFGLRDGREPRAGTIDRVRAYIAHYHRVMDVPAPHREPAE